MSATGERTAVSTFALIAKTALSIYAESALSAIPSVFALIAVFMAFSTPFCGFPNSSTVPMTSRREIAVLAVPAAAFTDVSTVVIRASTSVVIAASASSVTEPVSGSIVTVASLIARSRANLSSKSALSSVD